MVAQASRNYFSENVEPTNHRSLDRIFVLELGEGVIKANVDTRLINGNNHLHAIRHPQLSSWSFKLDHGMLPEGLKCSFTSFAAARKFIESFYIKRGVKVTEVLD